MKPNLVKDTKAETQLDKAEVLVWQAQNMSFGSLLAMLGWASGLTFGLTASATTLLIVGIVSAYRIMGFFVGEKALEFDEAPARLLHNRRILRETLVRIKVVRLIEKANISEEQRTELLKSLSSEFEPESQD